MDRPADFGSTVGIVVVADDPNAAIQATHAIECMNARMLARLAWDEAVVQIADYPAAPAVLIETAGVTDQRIVADLTSLVMAAGANRCVVTFARAQLDTVAGTLIGGDAMLLCDPTPAERVAALALALTRRPGGVREDSDETARLVRINQEVARFVETLGRLTGGDPGAAGGGALPIVGDVRGSFGEPPVETTAAATAADVRRAIRARRLRDDIFGIPNLFEDPAWDMLLDLFAAELEHRRVSVSSLCIAAAVAPTTALRWINKLIEIGLLERRPDEFDRRRAFVALTAAASTKMHEYLAAARRAGLGIA